MFTLKEFILNFRKNEETRSSFFWIVTFIVLIVVDQFIKMLAFKKAVVTVNTNFISIEPFANYHFAFSLLVPTVVMFFIYGLLLSAVLWHVLKIWKAERTGVRLSWVLILAGAVSNVGERAITRYVKDFLRIGTGYINIADMYIVLGIALLVVISFFPTPSSHTPKDSLY